VRIFRFICWLRGWHEAPYLPTKMDGLEVYGNTHLCQLCGTVPLTGKTEGSNTYVRWPFNAKPVVTEAKQP
jgi:hypothetical protein